MTELSKLAEERGVKANTVRNEVTRLMNEIAALGPVNHAALAHLEAAQEAIRLAEAQMQDLRQAIETLEAAIRRIDAETRARMRETFDKVNEKFNDTFRGLFGGGRAALRMEGDEILSAGVEVSAQPPGKRNQTVRLLSGGEQALTPRRSSLPCLSSTPPLSVCSTKWTPRPMKQIRDDWRVFVPK